MEQIKIASLRKLEDTSIPTRFRPKSSGSVTFAKDIVCFSHLRWDFVFQRPQHLLTRFASRQRVFFIEEPVFDSSVPSYEIHLRERGVQVVQPHLPRGLSKTETTGFLRQLIDLIRRDYRIDDCIHWYYTPMALEFARHWWPALTVFDCMDELSAFQFAPETIKILEAEMFDRADLVFTGGMSLYEAKKSKHPKVFAFPSSVDVKHFAKARSCNEEPEDQKAIPHPRIGFCGVIDERMDLELVAALSSRYPEYQFVFLGPVCKIDPASLPQSPNLHYLGKKTYEALPQYLSGWDVAMLPFALNVSTRFISPTKVPEYLAGGLPVVSTPIRDVVYTFGSNGLVYVGKTVEQFGHCLQSSLVMPNKKQWLERVDRHLAQGSWDQTFRSMVHLMELQLLELGRVTDYRLKTVYSPSFL